MDDIERKRLVAILCIERYYPSWLHHSYIKRINDIYISDHNVIWHRNGEMMCRVQTHDGSNNGLCEWWYDNGQLESMQEYKKGFPVGMSPYWTKGGVLTSIYTWLKGKTPGHGRVNIKYFCGF